MTITNCSVCGQVSPCGCGARYYPNTFTAPCGSCGSSNCCNPNNCCSPSGSAVPLPYYQKAGASPQSHTKQVTILNFATSIKIIQTWNIPACGETSVLYAEGLKAAVPGSFIWNPAWGFFEITAFDSSTSSITIVNHCNDGNAAVGTVVPACSEFVVSGPPCECPNNGLVCVAIDFTAPDVSACTDIILTSVEGIAVSDTVQIGTGFYRVGAVKPNNVITICNDGQGITPGTPVIAKNAAGDYNYCLSIIATNPCTNAPLVEGNLLICNDSRQQPLLSEIPGGLEIPALIVAPVLKTNTDQELVKFVAIDASDRICTLLELAVDIVMGTSNYTITVESTDDFNVGDLIRLENILELFTITAIGTGTFDITSNVPPALSRTVNVGNWVCQATCCEKLYAIVRGAETDQVADAFGGSDTLSTATPTFTYGPLAMSIVAGVEKVAGVLSLESVFSLTINGGNTNHAKITFAVQYRFDGGGWSSAAGGIQEFFMFSDTGTLVAPVFTSTIPIVVPENHTTLVETQYILTWGGDATATADIEGVGAIIRALKLQA